MSTDINALLGRGSEFEGKLTFQGTVRIDGRFTGEIYSDGTLIVGEGAEVQAEIRVAQVMVYGDVTGNVQATEGVELHAPAQLRGNITSPALHIDKGVFFDGSCQMSSGGTPADLPQPAVRTSALPARQPTGDSDVNKAAAVGSSPAASRISGLYQPEPAAKRTELKHSF
jgi:cytoskeletal protein CcmA (bactofilin family)